MTGTIFKANDHILDTDADAIVIPVTCDGVCDRGLMMEWADKYPDCYTLYKRECMSGRMSPGTLYSVTDAATSKFFVGIPTKYHHGEEPEPEYILSGLDVLVRFVFENKITSIAIPPLGAESKILIWEKTRQLIFSTMSVLSGVRIEIYEPSAK